MTSDPRQRWKREKKSDTFRKVQSTKNKVLSKPGEGVIVFLRYAASPEAALIKSTFRYADSPEAALITS